MKFGMIVRMDETGLGNQTKNLERMLKPDRLMIIDSTSFRNGVKQFPEWYSKHKDKRVINGFPRKEDMLWFLNGLTSYLTCEIPYGYKLITLSNAKRIKSYIQYNYEFLDYLRDGSIPYPTGLIAPSTWHINEVSAMYDNVKLLRPPLFLDDFEISRNVNFARTGKIRRFLFTAGTQATMDRNGYASVMNVLGKTKENFELVIKSQSPLPLQGKDLRLRYDYSYVEDYTKLYEGFDALIMPRRYGGLCLPMNEALASGLPVIMTDISPNNEILPKEWLIESQIKSKFMTRTMIDVFEVNEQKLAEKIDSLASSSNDIIDRMKHEAYDIAKREFDANVLVEKYKEFIL